MDELGYMIFYETWFFLAEGRDTDLKRLAFYDAIMRYAFQGVEPTKPVKGESKGEDWAAWDAFVVAKGVIDKHRKKAFAGMAGKGVSRNEGNSHASKNDVQSKQNQSKINTETKQKQSRNKANGDIRRSISCLKGEVEGEEVGGASAASSPSPSIRQDSDPFTGGDPVADAEAEKLRPTEEQVRAAAETAGVKPEVVDKWLEHMRMMDWRFMGGGRVTRANFRASLLKYNQKEREGRSRKNTKGTGRNQIYVEEGLAEEIGI